MYRSRREYFILIALLMPLFIWITIRVVPPRSFVRLAYRVVPFCWQCLDGQWQLGEGRTLSYRVPEGWETKISADNSTLNFSAKTRGVLHRMSVYQAEFDGPTMESILAERIPQIYEHYAGYRIVEEPQMVQVGRYQGAYAQIDGELYVSLVLFTGASDATDEFTGASDATDEPEQAVTLEDAENVLRMPMDEQVYLIAYQGIHLQIVIESAKFYDDDWARDQLQMILDSIFQELEQDR